MRRAAVARRNVPMQFQLTHSRGVRPAKKFTVDDFSHISTHALTWSATFNVSDHALGICISTHALTWSATLRCFAPLPAYLISTHALTWSATFGFAGVRIQNIFQLTHSRGVRRRT